MPNREEGQGQLQSRIGSAFDRIRRSDRLVSLADQGLLTGSKFLAIILFARWLTKEEFGELALVLAACFLLAGLQRSLVVLPFIATHRTVRHAQEASPSWLTLAGILIALLGATLAVIWAAATLADGPAWLTQMAGLLAILAPPVLLQEVVRRFLYQIGRFERLPWMGGAFASTYAAGVGLAYLAGPTLQGCVLALAVASSVAAVAGCSGAIRARRHRPGELLRTWLSTRHFTGWQFLAFLLAQVESHGLPLLIAVSGGATATVAVFTALRQLIYPVREVVSSVDLIDKPKAGRAFAERDFAGLVESIRGTKRFLLMLALPYLVFLGLFAEQIPGLVFGDKYAGYTIELYLLIAISFFGVLNQPQETELIIVHRSRTLFLVKLVRLAPLLFALGFLFDDYGLVGVLGGLLASRIIGWLLITAATQRHRRFARIGDAASSQPWSPAATQPRE